MGRTQAAPAASISRDSIAGLKSASLGSVRAAQTIIKKLAADTKANPPGDWKKIFRTLPRFMRNVRNWVMSEQETAFVGDTIASGSWDLGFGEPNQLYINFIRNFQPISSATYVVRNTHFAHNESYSIYRAPKAADYLALVHFRTICTDTEGETYLELFVQMRDDEQSAWQNAIIIGAATNVNRDANTEISISGFYLARLRRGNCLRFGIRQSGKSGVKATLQNTEARCVISKQKFYPTLKT